LKIVLTGATGFLGMTALARLVERGDDVTCLVRAPDARAAEDRLAEVCERIGVPVGSARALAGDMTAPFGAFPRADAVVHCAASVSFALPLDEARGINVGGTWRVLGGARAAGIERFVHVSTAYVAGDHDGVFGEDDLDVGQRFRNAYEQSKYESETLVRESGLDVRVVRPSIVVGESTTGWTSSFNVLYFPMQAFARGLVGSVPADPTGVVDVVPVDHVVDVTLAALDADEGGTLHAVAGDRAVSIERLARMAAEAFGKRVPEFVPPAHADLAEEHLAIYLPYFTVRTRFRDDRTRAAGLAAPALEDYFARLMEFAKAARWGKRELSRRDEPERQLEIVGS